MRFRVSDRCRERDGRQARPVLLASPALGPQRNVRPHDRPHQATRAAGRSSPCSRSAWSSSGSTTRSSTSPSRPCRSTSTPPARRCSGWSTPTWSSSPACCSPSARSATASVASARSRPGLALFGLSSLAVLFVDTPTQLIAVRALMGVGGALIMPATLSIITNVFPREERAQGDRRLGRHGRDRHRPRPAVRRPPARVRSTGRRSSSSTCPSLVAFVAGMRVVPESATPTRPLRRRRRDSPSRALVALVYGVIEAPERGWTSRAILGASRAAALGVAFVAWELRTPSRCSISAFRNPRFSIGSPRSASPSSRCSARSSRSPSTCSSPRTTARWRPARRWCRSPSAS